MHIWSVTSVVLHVRLHNKYNNGADQYMVRLDNSMPIIYKKTSYRSLIKSYRHELKMTSHTKDNVNARHKVSLFDRTFSEMHNNGKVRD